MAKKRHLSHGGKRPDDGHTGHRAQSSRGVSAPQMQEEEPVQQEPWGELKLARAWPWAP